jgi:hypothetical protein
MPAGEGKAVINRLLVPATLAFLAFTTRGNAENIVCPPQNDIVADFDKWSADYSGPLDEVWLFRQFLSDQEGAIIRCKRTMGSVQIMLQKKSCRIIPGAGKVESIPYGNEPVTSCSIGRPNPTLTNDETCVIVCK